MEAILMGAAMVVAVCAGTFLAIVLGAPVIGITWDLIVNRSLRAGAGIAADLRAAADLADVPVFHKESWYGRLVQQAYGRDRGWVVLLRRLFGATGFEYSAAPMVPQHAHANTGCDVCNQWRIERDAHGVRHRAAYAACLGILRRPPYQQPFYASAPDGNVCPTFWSVILAADVYLPFVYLPKVVMAVVAFVAVGVASAAVVMIARPIAATFRMLVAQFGRRIAMAMAMAVWGLSVYAVGSLAVIGFKYGASEYTTWQTAHVAAIEAATSERLAASEFRDHAVARAIEEDRYETAFTLAGLSWIARETDDWLARQQRDCDAVVGEYTSLSKGLAPSKHLITALAWCAKYQSEITSVWVAYRYDPNAYFVDHYVRQWWNDATRDYWEHVAIPSDARATLIAARDHGLFLDSEDRDAAINRAVEEVAFLASGDGDAIAAALAPYASAASAAAHHLETQLTVAFMRAAVEARMRHHGDLTEFLDAYCAENEGTWSSRYPTYDHHGLRDASCVRSSAGVTCGVPSRACAQLAGLLHRELAERRARIATAQEANDREAAERMAQERRNHAALLADLAALRGEPVALLAILERSCASFRASDGVEWYERSVSDLPEGTCAIAASMFKDEITTVQRFAWIEAKRAATVAWWHQSAALVGIGSVFVAVYLSVTGLLTFLVLRFGIADALTRLLAAFWHAPLIAAVRRGCAWVVGRALDVCVFCLKAFGWLLWQPFRLTGILLRAIGRGIRDTAVLIAAFAKGWYEKRCYQITWQ